MIRHCMLLLAVALLSALATSAFAQRLEVPRRHDRPPGPPLSPEEAVARMTVPEGFSVEIVAAEPDVVNPVAMCIDDKGRFWITESVEYPRREPGPGRDRVKVLEDTTGDGKVDKVTVFADGLNIPSGIAVGHGGVWVANAPDILFMQDTDGDLKADKIEKVVTGFGRLDTHELPNSLTWGPDGWLYGLNGVFNNSHVKYTPENPNFEVDHPGWPLTCAMFRIHPRTRQFEIFAEGTSNPWGIAFNDEGDAFISACVIDHLWHIVETGYYIRQGGPYPPHTWPMRSIVDHKHQKAAYCGLTWFDSDAYPEEYRNVFYMGNIHGGCINADIVERSGSTYKGKPHPGFPPKPGAWDDDEYDTIRKTGDPENPKLADFLTANDPWFMPVVQKTGPDGCLYILDWYDRYHCYQDANADPEGIDRSKGRLYRVVYRGHEHHQAQDLASKSNETLIHLLVGPSEYERQTAQRLLSERLWNELEASEMGSQLERIIRSSEENPELRLRALWTLASGGRLTQELCRECLTSTDANLQRWALRLGLKLAGQLEDVSQLLLSLEDVPQPWSEKVLLEVATNSQETVTRLRTNSNDSALRLLMTALEFGRDDPLIQHVVWQNLIEAIPDRPVGFVGLLSFMKDRGQKLGGLDELLIRALDLMCDQSDVNLTAIHQMLALLHFYPESDALWPKALEVIATHVKQGTFSDESANQIKTDLEPYLEAKPGGEWGTFLLALWGDEAALKRARNTAIDSSIPTQSRALAIETLAAARDENLFDVVSALLKESSTNHEFVAAIIDRMSQVDDVRIARLLIAQLSDFHDSIRPRAIEVLTQRPEWSVELLKAIKLEHVDRNALNLNQLKRLALFKNDKLQELLAETYGAIRQDRRSDRQQVINRMRDFLSGTPGDPERGIAAYNKVCGQCHKIYGEGAEVGPDITRNGRNNWEQLLQNVFDPSAVIGPGYQARTLVTVDGRVLTGLPVEESDQRVVLKIQGGKTETIPRDQIEAYAVSEMSMMPEDLEKQLTPQEIADLFAFLALDKPPSDPTGKLLPGAPQPKSR